MQRDKAYLLDMLHEGRIALEFVAGMDFARFEQDVRCQYAVIRAIEVMGEAAGRVSDELVESHPEVPWGRIIGMRNRMIHGYDDIVLSIVWEVVQTDVPELIATLEPMIPANWE